MTQNREYGSAGDLLKEVQEVQKLVSAKDIVEDRSSTTAACGVFLTIICC